MRDGTDSSNITIDEQAFWASNLALELEKCGAAIPWPLPGVQWFALHCAHRQPVTLHTFLPPWPGTYRQTQRARDSAPTGAARLDPGAPTPIQIRKNSSALSGPG